MLRSAPRYAFLAALPLLTAAPVFAHNGAVAIAIPVEGIRLDGDLSDWPPGLQSHAVDTRKEGPAPTGASDLCVRFRVAHSETETCLYVAVEVVDDEITARDDCQVSVDDLHIPTREAVETAVVVKDSLRTYEVRVPVQAGSGTVGLSVEVEDSDDGIIRTVSWGGAGTGDVVLGSGDQTGQLQGRVRWQTGAPAARVQVTVRSQSDSALWIQTLTDRDGSYGVGVPPGAYSVAAVGQQALREVVGGGTAEVELAGRAEGKRWTQAAPASRLAGPGQRQGPWQTYGYTDGLPPATVTALAQDAEGTVWIGTGREGAGEGVVRYDGARLWQYTTSDGLAGDNVGAIAIEADGAVLVGCTGGLSRFDGDAFTSYTTADGLVSEQVNDVLVAADGTIWLATSRGVSHFSGSSFVNYTDADGLSGGEVRALAEDAVGNIWAAAQSDLYRWDGDTWKVGDQSHGMWWLTDLLFDEEGRLWLGGEYVAVCAAGSCDTLTAPVVNSLALDHDGAVWVATWGWGIRRYDGTELTTYRPSDGVANDQMFASLVDEDGDLWFGAMGGGLSRFHGRTTTYTTADDLLYDLVFDVTEDRHGNIWAGTGGGVARFDGTTWTTWDGDDFGLTWREVDALSLLEANDGVIWIGTREGLARYDRGHWSTTTERDGLALHSVAGLAEDVEGRIWLTDAWMGDENLVVSYDGTRWTTHPLPYGPRSVWASPDGGVWFGGSERVSVFREGAWTHWGSEHGLQGVPGITVYGDADGTMWLGSFGTGLLRQDGAGWSSIGELAHDKVTDVTRDRNGRLWVGTFGAGVIVSDGQVSQQILRGNGLRSDLVQDIHQALDGEMWIATEGGLTRYLPTTTPPSVRITRIIADHPLSRIDEVNLPATQDYLLVEYEGASLRTPLDHLVYRYRVKGLEEKWHNTRERQVELAGVPIGEYELQVQAVDQDLNYSPQTSVRIVVHPAYGQIALRAGLVLSLAGLALAAATARRRRRERDRIQQQLLHDMEEELQTAHQMQMDLLPRQAPALDGYRIAGRAAPANHVGGDYFQYFERDGLVTICLADTTGHAMEAAIPAVMSSGILDKQMEIPGALRDRFDSLNRSCCRSLRQHTYVCLAMLDLDPVTGTMQVGNCGCPYPLHFRASSGELQEVQVEAYPLGVRPDTEYRAIDVRLLPGDYVVLHSDGFSEASDANQQMFGFDRTMEVIRQGCSEGLSPEDLIERLLAEVKAFTGDEPQADDMTCVVIKVEV